MGSYVSVPETQQPSHREKRQRSPEEVDNDVAANKPSKKQRVERPPFSNNDTLRIDCKRVAGKMNKYLDRKIKEYQWLRARTDHLEETDEEREAITKMVEEIEQASDKMVEILEHFRVLLEEEDKPFLFYAKKVWLNG